MSKLFLGTRAIVPAITSTITTSLNVTPTTAAQVIVPTGGVDGYNPVNVSAVTSSIDSNIVPGNIKKDVTILGVTGTLDAGRYFILDREVSAGGVYQMPASSFTFSLPSNITELGDYALPYAFYGCTSLTGALDLSNLTTISGGGGMYDAFYGCTGLTSVDLSNLTTVSGGSGMLNAFYGCTGLTGALDLSNLTIISGNRGMDSVFYGCTGLTSVDLSGLTTISGSYGMQHTFRGCTGLTSVDLSSLTTVSNSYGMNGAFYGCTGLTGALDLSSLVTVSGSSGMSGAFRGCTGLTSVDLSALTTISGNYGMQRAFQSCNSLTSVDLSSLTTISGNYGMQNALYYCTGLTSISFPALTSTFNVPASGTTYTNQFNQMLYGVTGCTVHFPSNLQSVIGSWSDVTAGFGGTNTIVLYDLPATT